MALPIVAASIMKHVGIALKNWKGVLSISGLFATGALSLNAVIRQAGETALSLWPLLALFFLFLFAREVARSYFKAKESAARFGDKG